MSDTIQNPYKKYLALIYYMQRNGTIRQYKRRGDFLRSVEMQADRHAIELTRKHPGTQVSVSVYRWNNDEGKWDYMHSVEHVIAPAPTSATASEASEWAEYACTSDDWWVMQLETPT